MRMSRINPSSTCNDRQNMKNCLKEIYLLSVFIIFPIHYNRECVSLITGVSFSIFACVKEEEDTMLTLSPVEEFILETRLGYVGKAGISSG